MAVQKLAAGYFFPNFSHSIFVANIMALDKGERKIEPIPIVVVIRRVIAKALMSASIAEANSHLEPFQVGSGVKSSLDAIAEETLDTHVKLSRDPTTLAPFSMRQTHSKIRVEPRFCSKQTPTPLILLGSRTPCTQQVNLICVSVMSGCKVMQERSKETG